MPTTFHLVFKVIIVGASNVGKTSAIQRFVDKTFMSVQKSTIGVDFALKTIQVTLGTIHPTSEQVTLQLWDLAGEQKYQAILPYYLAGTQGIIFAFDGTEPLTLVALDGYMAILKTYLDITALPAILISTKHDLTTSIHMSEVQDFMLTYIIQEYIPTSALTGLNIDHVFQHIGQLLLQNLEDTDHIPIWK